MLSLVTLTRTIFTEVRWYHIVVLICVSLLKVFSCALWPLSLVLLLPQRPIFQWLSRKTNPNLKATRLLSSKWPWSLYIWDHLLERSLWLLFLQTSVKSLLPLCILLLTPGFHVEESPTPPSKRPECEKEQGFKEQHTCGVWSFLSWFQASCFITIHWIFHSAPENQLHWTIPIRRGGRQRIKLWHSPGDSSLCPCFILRHVHHHSSLEAGQGTWPLKNHTQLQQLPARQVPWPSGGSASPLRSSCGSECPPRPAPSWGPAQLQLVTPWPGAGTYPGHSQCPPWSHGDALIPCLFFFLWLFRREEP